VDHAHPDVQELLRLERGFGEAITRGDSAALDSLMADDFVGINPLCRVLPKKQVLAEIASPDYELESLVNEDINIRLFGDVAVATARGTAKGRYKGQDAGGQFLYTRVWARRNGVWRAVAAHATNLA